MAEIHIGERVINKKGEIGTITGFDDSRVMVDFESRSTKFLSDAFENGFLIYAKADLQKKVQERIAQLKLEEEKKKAEEERIAKKKDEAAQNAVTPRSYVSSDGVKFESVVRFIDPAPVSLSSVKKKKDKEFVQNIFNECEKDTENLFKKFKPWMVYPNYTSRSRSKYCVGFLSKYLDNYVFRIFSRNDVYKKTQRNGVTVMESNTAEVLRVIQINGKLYYFSKNISYALGYYNNTDSAKKWQGSQTGTNVFLNEIICDCDCGYLNGYVSDKNINIQAFLFIDLLFQALVNNKAEIVFKNKAFASTYNISNLSGYLEEFTSKQVDFASKHDVIHALPFMKEFGISDIGLLRDLDSVRDGGYTSAYNRLNMLCERLNYDCPDLDKRIMNFVKNTENFNAAMYKDYLCELFLLPVTDVTPQDLFDRNYIAHHDRLIRNRMAGYDEIDSREVNEEYTKAAKALSWIDRKEKGYFISVPKTIAEFKSEGNAQHNCVYTNRYYRKVVEKRSIIVFLRKEKYTPYVTIEYNYETFRVLQALGKYNQKIDPELYEYIVNLGKKLYYEMHTLN